MERKEKEKIAKFMGYKCNIFRGGPFGLRPPYLGTDLNGYKRWRGGGG